MAWTDNLAVSIFLAIISVIGVPGNVLVLKVYCRKARKLSTYVFISFMAISDLFLCVLTPLHTAFILVTDPGKKQVLCNIEIFITAVCRILSFLTSAVVAFDRYVAVCWPHTKRLSVPTSLILSMTCAVYSVVLSIPAFFIVPLSLDEYDFISCKSHFDTHPLFRIGAITVSSTVFISTVATVMCYTLVWRSIRNQRMVINLSRQVPAKKVGNNFAVDVRYTTGGKKYANMSSKVSIHFANTNQNINRKGPIEGKLASNDHEFKGGKCKANNINVSEESTRRTISVTPNTALMLPQTTTDLPNDKKSRQHLSEENQNRGNPGSSCAPTYGNEDVDKSPAVTASTATIKSSKLTVMVQRRITMMLFLIATISITTTPIGMLARLVPDSKLRDVKYTSEVLFVIIRVAEYLGFINNAVNPFIYSLFDKRFRKECFKSFTCVPPEER
ncbi:D(2)-like dopamine receptor [Holothuria leucospilota]|uniref:D(2)-like dopamine receptor n=1 Tax=Holothuria leucospilota TaxID=206669 RepID=A0A9Q0YEM4_HOLLE|nr:D(2)-like dopamine receptor [Holothuria leucospilota]